MIELNKLFRITTQMKLARHQPIELNSISVELLNDAAQSNKMLTFFLERVWVKKKPMRNIYRYILLKLPSV